MQGSRVTGELEWVPRWALPWHYPYSWTFLLGLWFMWEAPPTLGPSSPPSSWNRQLSCSSSPPPLPRLWTSSFVSCRRDGVVVRLVSFGLGPRSLPVSLCLIVPLVGSCAFVSSFVLSFSGFLRRPVSQHRTFICPAAMNLASWQNC